MTARWKRFLRNAVIVVLVIGLPLVWFGWYKFFRDVPQPASITGDQEKNFLYGSIGSENRGGIPYWIVVVLPRIFGEYLPGPGGYASLGLPWQEGQEFPAGFSKKTLGFERVAFNCALCHATRYRTTEQETPTIVAAGGSHTADIQGLLDFFSKAANDPRFNAETILTEIDFATRLSWIDRMIYKYILIPATKKQLSRQGREFGWTSTRPRWGPGRDAPMNLTKFNLLHMQVDESIDHTDFPAIWNLNARMQAERSWPEQDYARTADLPKLGIPPERLMLMNLAGDTTSIRSVLIDSALGLQAQNSAFFRDRMASLEAWLRALPPPKYPIAPAAEEQALVATGRTLFDSQCAACHKTGETNRMGTVIPLEEIGTDPERAWSWSREAADGTNAVVATLGIRRTPMSKPAHGYIAVPLHGLWLRAPYLHNGSVPTVRALLEPAGQRPKTFYRGFDLLDREHIGFVSRRRIDPAATASDACPPSPLQSGCMPPGAGWLYDTTVRGNHNTGHEYGTQLSPADKRALIAFLKTL
jgi:mono/diheme cytochrome c family protein